MFPRTLQMLLTPALACGISLAATLARPAVAYTLAGIDNGCSQDPKEQTQLISEAETNNYTIRRVEFFGNATIRYNVLNRRLLFTEGDIFTRKLLERGVKNLSRLKIIEAVQLDDVEVRLDREYKDIDILFCVKERRRSR